jgi:hypothetical protein
MFSGSNQFNTSLPDIAADLGQQFTVTISKEGIHKKFNAQAVSFLKALIKSHTCEHLVIKDDAELKKHFNAINIKDSSKFSLPSNYDGAYPGFGNFSKTNGLMNIQYEYDIMSGNWKTIELTTIRNNDQQDSKLNTESIQPGELYIRDLGYITPAYLKNIILKGAGFLNRIPPQAMVYTLDNNPIDWSFIDRKFNKMKADVVDMDVQIYQKELIGCRLIIERVSDEVYRKRIKQAEQSAKKHGVGLTQKHKIRCRYNTFITNISKQILPAEKLRKCYYLRWQIELVFKTWKSFLHIDKVKRVKKERFECQLLAKLLWILLNWRLFQSCNIFLRSQHSKSGVSILKFFKRSIVFSFTLRSVVLKRLPLRLWLNQIFLPLIDNTACEAPTGKTTMYEILYSFNTLS